MTLKFKSIRSSSAANCVLISTGSTQILIDCGIESQTECKRLLNKHAGRIEDIDAVLVSHSHTDHINHHTLHVLAVHGIPIRAHRSVLKQIYCKHKCTGRKESPVLAEFSDDSFQVGDLEITPMEVPHEPGVPTYGFVIHHRSGSKRRKVVVCTDFYSYENVVSHFADADLIFVESNHDLDLLKKNPNYASRYHLSNPRTAGLLYHAISDSKHSPQHVMLGHLSDERNREKLALGTIEKLFDQKRRKLDFELSAAPLYKASETICVE